MNGFYVFWGMLVVILFAVIVFGPTVDQAAAMLWAGSASAVTSYSPTAPVVEQAGSPFVVNGNAGQVVGVVYPEHFALPITQQPVGQEAFVTSLPNEITQFGLPAQYGVVALLGHNYLDGKRFFELSPGATVTLYYGDGHEEVYQVTQVENYQALKPNSPYSEFVGLDVGGAYDGQIITSATLFNHLYTTPGRVVFQTCIDAYGEPSWGRFFVIAEKIN